MLNDTLRDVYWTFVLPSICLVSLLANTINIWIFNSIKSSNIIYKYMLVNGVFDQAYLITVFFVFTIRCGQFCEIKNSYMAQFYAVYIYGYTASSLSLFGILLEISILVQRYMFLASKDYLKRINKTIMFCCLFVFCFVYHMPQLSTFEIIELNASNKSHFSNSTKMFTRHNRISGRSFFIRNLVAFQTAIRLLLIMVLIFFLKRLSNLLFKRYEEITVESRQNQKSSRSSKSSKSEENFLLKLIAPRYR